MRRVRRVVLSLALALIVAGHGAGAQQESAFAEGEVELLRRFVQPSNDLRLAVLEEELRWRGLPYELQTFSGGGADEARAEGHNVVVSLGDGPAGVVVGGHFDAELLEDGSLSHGLVDNAAGVLLRVAEALQDTDLEGRVDVIFFDMEELGLIGSTAYAETVELAPGAVMVNVDIVAYGDTLFYGPGQLTGGQTLADHVHRVCVLHAVGCVGTPGMPSSDDRSFQRAGVPAISLAMLPAEEAHRMWLLLNGELSDGLREELTPPILRTIHAEHDTEDQLEPGTVARVAGLVVDLVLARTRSRTEVQHE